MKKLVCYFFIIFTGFTLYAQSIEVQPITQTVNTSQVFITTVEIFLVQNLGGFELEIDFDSILLQCNDVTLESFLGSTGRTVFPLANNIDNTNGLIEFAVTTLGAIPPGPNGDGILLTIEWTATSSLSSTTGTNLVLHNVQVSEPNGTLIPVTHHNGTVIIVVGGGPLSVIANSNPDTVCSGSTSQLTAMTTGGTASYSYSWISDPSGFTSTQQNPIAIPVITTTYTVIVDDGNTTSSDNVSVVVNPLPTADAGADQTISMNSSTVLNGSASGGTHPYLWNWSPPSLLNNPYVQNPTTKNLTMSQSYVLLVTDANGCSHSDGVNIVVDQPTSYLSVTPANQNVSASAGSKNFTLSSNVSWTVTDDASWLSVSPASGTNAGLLTATYDANMGAQRVATITVSGNGVPDVNVIVTQASSSAQTTVLINPIAQTVNTSQVFSTTVEIFQVQNLGGFELDIDFNPALLQCNSVTLETFLGSTGRTVFPLTNNINNTNGLIEFAATTMGPNPPGPNGDGVLLTIEWTTTSTLSVTTVTDLMLQNIQITEPNGTLIPVSLQDATVTVFVAGGPLTVNATATPATVCNGDNSQLNANAFGGTGTYTYFWASNPPGFNSNQKDPVVTPSVTTTYIVEVFDGSDTESDMVMIVVNPLPVSDAGPDDNICENDSYTLNGTSVNYTSVQWATSGDGTFSDISILNPNYTPGTNDISAGSVTLSLTAIGQTPCTNPIDAMVLTINPAPVPVITGAIEVCEYETGLIYSTPLNTGNTYNWAVTGGMVMSGQGSNEITVDWGMVGAGTVVVTETIATTLCSTTTPDYNVTIHQLPLVDIGPDTIICDYNTITLDAGNTGSNYIWSTGETTRTIVVNSVSGSGVYSVTVTDPNGCFQSDTIIITFDPCTSLDGVDKLPRINIYPNPSNGKINIQLFNMLSEIDIDVINIHGQTVLKDNVFVNSSYYRREFDFSKLSRGVYYINFRNKKVLMTKKLVIQ